MQTTGHFTVARWDERTVGTDEHPKLAQASITNTFTGGIEAGEVACEYTLVYSEDLTGAFTGVQLVRGAVDGREGSFALQERGHFGADGGIRSTFEVVPGSGTGELAGLHGTGEYTAEHGVRAVPFTFDYEL
ncbi:DUF3224 domain-containing protein [Saccharopolyspora sp. NPDC000359]|uniref:DUF3224 domain-containing protein n=1 Tax=Saccharopolyspora sp. NPDC000359 TaxID=3154251 RepID=UPI00332DE4B9